MQKKCIISIFSKNEHTLNLKHLTCEIYIRNYANFPILIFGCQEAVEKIMFTCPVQNLVQSIFSRVAALTNPDVDLSWAKFSSSLVDIKICHSQ